MGKGGSVDSSGVYAALASAQAAQEAYALGEQQLQWAKDVWNQMQPLITAADTEQINLAKLQEQSMRTQEARATDLWNTYQQNYGPLMAQVAAEAQDWASPQAMALYTGEAKANVAENVAQGINTAKETLRGYGVNPNSPELAGLYVGANTMGAAAEAAAGTTEATNLRNQQVAMEQGAVNTGLALTGQSGQLVQTGTQAGAAGSQSASGAGQTAMSNLTTGSNAFTAPVNWFNTGAANMNVYTNAVNQLNQQNYQNNALSASALSSGLQGIGSIAGMFMPAAKGGPVGMYENGGETGLPSGPSTASSSPTPQGEDPGGFVPLSSSPSGGKEVDDVNSLLTAGEFVIPKRTVDHLGTDFFYKLIDKSDKQMNINFSRDDVGGEMATGIPSGPVMFQSRPGQPNTLQPPQPPQPQPQQVPAQPIPMLPGGMPPRSMPPSMALATNGIT